MNNDNEITFNDMPNMLAKLLNKVETMEHMLNHIKEDLSIQNIKESDHRPMNTEEACELLKIGKTTLYYHIRQGELPVTKRGKSYIFFKDELIKWQECGRKNDVPLTSEERMEQMKNKMKRKPKNYI